MPIKRLVVICSASGILLLLTWLAYYWYNNTYEPFDWNTPFRVDLTNYHDARVYQLSMPRGVLWFSKATKVDYRRRYLETKSVSLNWHYPSGNPRYLWNSLHSDSDKAQATYLFGDIEFIGPAEKLPSTIAKEVYFDNRHTQYAPMDGSAFGQSVWNNTAKKYNNTIGETYFLITKRLDTDGIVINCTQNASYCYLHGATINQDLYYDYISIPADDVKNWKLYQTKAIEWFQQTIIETIPATQP